MTTYAQDRAVEIATSPEAGKKKANGLHKMKEIKLFWEDLGVIYPIEWEFLDEVREVRNLIVHDNGRRHAVDGMKQQKRSKRVEDFISARTKAGKTDLSFDRDELVVTPEFCLELSQVCNTFLQLMIERIPKMPDSEFRIPPSGE